MEIIPAILPASREDLEEKLTRLVRAGFEGFVQLDAVDGRFARPACWPFSSPKEKLPKTLPMIEQFRYDADLMVEDALAEAERLAAAGAVRLTIHAESALNLGRLLGQLRARLGYEKGFAPAMLELGLALSIETPLSLIEPHVEAIDYVQLMGIAHIGRQHEPLDQRVIPRIEALHKTYPHISIQVDGGVSLASAPQLIKAGATRLVVGSALFGAEDLRAEIRKFKRFDRPAIPWAASRSDE